MSIISNIGLNLLIPLTLNMCFEIGHSRGPCAWAVIDALEKQSETGRANRQGIKSGAPTPTGVGLDNAHQEFADDQHRIGLAHSRSHSSLPAKPVQQGRSA
ncbi:hypothetical protein [Pseudomonas sp.]|uniref:hypothetical protein n=1 Tax=Pseudomonas sp. TaxID=306 RepID=UPI0028AF2319|nr:hypothetical protein [Pseudomonas sp.]